MTTRAPRNSRPLTAGQAFDRLMARIESRIERREASIATAAFEFDEGERDFDRTVAARVDPEHRDRLLAMLATVPTMAPETEPTEPVTGWTGEPCPDELLPAGAQPYVPGPAARGRR